MLLPGLDCLKGLMPHLLDQAALVELLDGMVNVVNSLAFVLHLQHCRLHLVEMGYLLCYLRLLQLCLLFLLLDLLLAPAPLGAGLHQVEGGALGCADRLALGECLGDLRIQLDVELPLLRYLLMPLVNKHINPITKLLTGESVDDVDDVLARQLISLR